MKTTAVTLSDITRSVLAVPPLARHDDLSLDRESNLRLMRHLESGGVRTLLYGGNANLYNMDTAEYGSFLDMIEELAGADTWVIPSVGPDYGKLMAEARILKSRKFPTVMVLPLKFPSTGKGTADGIRRFTDETGLRVIAYVKDTHTLQPDDIAALVQEGRITAVKYAVVLQKPEQDDFLTHLLQRVDKQMVISGIGERPAIVHLRQFGLPGFTSGSVCVAPRGSTALLKALHEGRYEEAEKLRAAYIPLEDCRDEMGPIPVLHEAVTASGIADMGPMLPMMSRLEESYRAKVKVAARELLKHDETL
ncbi:MAG TPA: dihydrodipicolinate synthase family protein [Castellaniella sp.]|uniref:dihydrodipicolinate synthase family protein n=1 Tax=Castellaniella sp. TaxID=1955812 RepID=UPI002EFD375C